MGQRSCVHQVTCSPPQALYGRLPTANLLQWVYISYGANPTTNKSRFSAVTAAHFCVFKSPHPEQMLTYLTSPGSNPLIDGSPHRRFNNELEADEGKVLTKTGEFEHRASLLQFLNAH
jgi:hypothetical protein